MIIPPTTVKALRHLTDYGRGVCREESDYHSHGLIIPTMVAKIMGKIAVIDRENKSTVRNIPSIIQLMGVLILYLNTMGSVHRQTSHDIMVSIGQGYKPQGNLIFVKHQIHSQKG
jgi:hypothetical protein